MENLTRERAHDLCVEHWNDIAENGYSDKHKSALVRKYVPKLGCFACEHYAGVCGNCEACPFNLIFSGCLTKNSPYGKWREVGHCDRTCNQLRIFKMKREAIAIADLFIE